MTLVAIFAYGPSALLITIGVLILVFGHATKDVVFGVMTLSLTVTLLGGVALTIVYVRRESSVAQLQTEFVNKVSRPANAADLDPTVCRNAAGQAVARSGKIQQVLDIIATETKRLSEMVERLLGWARMEAGRREYHYVDQGPSEVIDVALRAFEPQVLTYDPGKIRIEKQQ